MSQKQNSFSYEEFKGVEECSQDVQALFKKAKEVLNNAYAPYSKFKVGAALMLEDGEVFTGTNQENAAYPSGLCAERVAIFAAKSEKPETKIKNLVIVSSASKVTEPVAPCGACRQVLLEYEFLQKEKFDIYIQGPKGSIIKIPSAQSLLPFSFHSEMLNA